MGVSKKTMALIKEYTGDDGQAAQPLEPDNIFSPPEPLPNVAPRGLHAAMDSALKHAGVYEACAAAYEATECFHPFIGYPALAAMEENTIYRALIDPVVKKIMKSLPVLNSRARSSDRYDNADTIKKIEDQFKRFNILALLKWTAGRVYGSNGCLWFIDTGERGEDLKTPLIRDSRKLHNRLRGFIKVEPQHVYPSVYDMTDPLARDFFKPYHWYMNGKPVHRSRFIKFVPNSLPNLLLPKYNFFGLPLGQVMKWLIDDFVENYIEFTKMAKRTNLDVFSADLQEILNTDIMSLDGDSAVSCESNTRKAVKELMNRIELFQSLRDNSSALVIDKEHEDFKNITTTVTGFDVLFDKKLEFLKFCIMYVSGENINDRISEERSAVFNDPVAELLTILMLDAMGEVDEDISFTWPDPHELTELEHAEKNAKDAARDAIYADRQHVSPEEIRTKLATDPNSGFNFIDVDNPQGLRADNPTKAENWLGTPEYNIARGDLIGQQGGAGETQALESEGSTKEPTYFNGAQITAMVDVVAEYNKGSISRGAAIEILQTGFLLGEQQAYNILGNAPSLQDVAKDELTAAEDADQDRRWITLKNGCHMLVNENGVIRGGCGGKFNGRAIDSLSDDEQGAMSKPEARQEIGRLWDQHLAGANQKASAQVGVVSDKLISKAKSSGLNLEGHLHEVDVYGIRHGFKEHGGVDQLLQGQIPITKADFQLIPDIVADHDNVDFSQKSRTTGLPLATYEKVIDGIKYTYVEEIRPAKKTLTSTTLWKKKA